MAGAAICLFERHESSFKPGRMAVALRIEKILEPFVPSPGLDGAHQAPIPREGELYWFPYRGRLQADILNLERKNSPVAKAFKRLFDGGEDERAGDA